MAPDEHPVKESRPRLRADARRNVDALIDGARTVFAREGVEAFVKDVAQESGVGVATLYRHFPKRSDLVLAVLQTDVEDCIDAAGRLAGAHPPGEALVMWIDRYCSFVATKHGLAAALHSDETMPDGLGTRLLAQLEPALDELMQSAHTAGEIEAGISAMDLLRAVAHLCTPGLGDVDYTRRMVALLLDGLRHRAAALRLL